MKRKKLILIAMSSVVASGLIGCKSKTKSEEIGTMSVIQKSAYSLPEEQPVEDPLDELLKDITVTPPMDSEINEDPKEVEMPPTGEKKKLNYDLDPFADWGALAMETLAFEGKTCDSDLTFIRDCIDQSGANGKLPDGDWDTYYKETKTVPREESLIGDLVFFLDPSGKVEHVGIKTARNRMDHVSNGTVVDEYITNYSKDFTCARIFPTDKITDNEMAEAIKQDGFMISELVAGNGIDLTPIESFRDELQLELSNMYSDWAHGQPCEKIGIAELDPNAYEGKGIDAQAVADNIAHIVTIHYDYELKKLYLLP